MIELQPQGYRSEALLQIGREQIQFGEDLFDVIPSNDEVELSPGSRVFVETVLFADPVIAEQMDAAYIRIEPGVTTPIQIFDNTTTFIESVTSGSGSWVGVSPDGEVVQYDFDADSDENPGLLIYGESWIGSWIAGEEGLEILEICVPPYQEDNNIENVSVLDEALPLSFQALYLSLVDMASVLEVNPSDPIIIHDGTLIALEYLTQLNSPEISVAEVVLNGTNQITINQESDAAYCVREGKGTFIVWEDGNPVTHEVEKGSVIAIPVRTPYQDSGDMKLVVVNRPAFDPEKVRTLTLETDIF